MPRCPLSCPLSCRHVFLPWSVRVIFVSVQSSHYPPRLLICSMCLSSCFHAVFALCFAFAFPSLPACPAHAAVNIPYDASEGNRGSFSVHPSLAAVMPHVVATYWPAWPTAGPFCSLPSHSPGARPWRDRRIRPPVAARATRAMGPGRGTTWDDVGPGRGTTWDRDVGPGRGADLVLERFTCREVRGIHLSDLPDMELEDPPEKFTCPGVRRICLLVHLTSER